MPIIAADELEVIQKTPSEKVLCDMEFRRILPIGSTISSVSATAIENQGNVSGSDDVTLGTASYLGTRAQVFAEVGGTDLEDYLVTITITTSDGETRQGWGMLEVRL